MMLLIFSLIFIWIVESDSIRLRKKYDDQDGSAFWTIILSAILIVVYLKEHGII